MAIHNSNTQAQTTTADMSFASAQQNEQQASATMMRQFSFHDDDLVFDPVGANPAGEQLVKLMEKLEEIYKAPNSKGAVNIKLVPIDRNNNQSMFASCIAVVVSMKSAPKIAAYHTLILEATADRPQPIMHNISGETFEQHRVAGEAFDSLLVAEINKLIREAMPGVELFNVDAEVVPSVFDLNNDQNVRLLARNASFACVNELRVRQPSFSDLNMALFARDSNLVVSPRFERTTVNGFDGLPRRSDIRIEMISQQNRQQNQMGQQQSLNTGDRAAKISEISAFVDLLWAPVAPSFNPQMGMPVMASGFVMPTQKYAANIILTGLESKTYTIANTLLALTTVRSVTESNNWYGTFRSNGVRSSMQDIGFLNIEANMENNANGVGQAIDTSRDTFSNVDLYKYLNHIIRPGAIISMDVPETGPESWYLSVFSVAASDSKKNKEAQAAIYAAAMTLTNGAFEKFFPQNAPMFDNVGNRVHLGYYEGADGMLHDIRDFDYVAIAALTKSTEEIKRWSDTMSSNLPQVVRLARRKRIIQALVSANKVNFTGYANRVTFSKMFIDALVQACAAVGVTPRLDGAAIGMTQVDRGQATWVDNSLVAPNNGGYFTTGVSGGQGYNNYSFGNFRNF